MTDTSNEIGIDRLLLTYLFDPDEGLAEEITDLLNAKARDCENLEQHVLDSAPGGTVQDIYRGKLEVAEADLEFYTDVWQKVQARIGTYFAGVDEATGSDETVHAIITKTEYFELKTPEAIEAYFKSIPDAPAVQPTVQIVNDIAPDQLSYSMWLTDKRSDSGASDYDEWAQRIIERLNLKTES